MTELLVGTKKGLFVLAGDCRGGFAVTARAFAGEPVEFAVRDARTGRVFAAAGSPFYGPKLWWTDDPVSGEWRQAAGVQLPEGGDAALQRIWVVVPGERDGLVYAGGDPGVLFESDDGGETWQLNEGVFTHPTRDEWHPGGGGLCLHTIVPWPGDPQRLSIGISAVGVMHTDDGGVTWRHANRGIFPRYMPEDQRDVEHQHCVHCFRRSTADPERLFMQFHGGVYRSDDAGASWVDARGEGLPSDFGFPIAIDPADPDSAFVIPLTADVDRVTPGGRVAVYETRDGGANWQPKGQGLPATDAYLTVLREAFDETGSGSELGLYFGATSGEVFGSDDAGANWTTVAHRLPPVYSVRASA